MFRPRHAKPWSHARGICRRGPQRCRADEEDARRYAISSKRDVAERAGYQFVRGTSRQHRRLKSSGCADRAVLAIRKRFVVLHAARVRQNRDAFNRGDCGRSGDTARRSTNSDVALCARLRAHSRPAKSGVRSVNRPRCIGHTPAARRLQTPFAAGGISPRCGGLTAPSASADTLEPFFSSVQTGSFSSIWVAPKVRQIGTLRRELENAGCRVSLVSRHHPVMPATCASIPPNARSTVAAKRCPPLLRALASVASPRLRSNIETDSEGRRAIGGGGTNDSMCAADDLE